MSKKVIGIILILVGVILFHVLGSHPVTTPIWETSISDKIYSNPVIVNERAYFIAGDKGKQRYKVHELNFAGQITATTLELPALPFEPLAIGDVLVISDRSRVIRGFTIPGLSLKWETGTPQPFRIPPMPSDNIGFLIQGDDNSLFSIDSQTGEALWSQFFTDSLVNYSANQVVACIHGHKHAAKPEWRLSILDTEFGDILWTYDKPVSGDRPLFLGDTLITTSLEGQVIVFDQFSGKQLYQNMTKGLRLINAFDSQLLLLAAGGSQVVNISLTTGDSWSTSLQSGFTGVAHYDNKILISDKNSVRCFDLNTGDIFWQLSLQDIYNAFTFKQGIFITHKNSFFDRRTYGSYIETESNSRPWIAEGQSSFHQPVATSKGDLLLSYNGKILMMPPATNHEPLTDQPEDSTEDLTPPIWEQTEEQTEPDESKDKDEQISEVEFSIPKPVEIAPVIDNAGWVTQD